MSESLKFLTLILRNHSTSPVSGRNVFANVFVLGIKKNKGQQMTQDNLIRHQAKETDSSAFVSAFTLIYALSTCYKSLLIVSGGTAAAHPKL